MEAKRALYMKAVDLLLERDRERERERERERGEPDGRPRPLCRAMPTEADVGECFGRAGMPAAMPEAGVGCTAALDRVATIALAGSAQLDHPGYFAVRCGAVRAAEGAAADGTLTLGFPSARPPAQHMDPQTCEEAVAASILMCGLNQNMLHPDVGPSARRLESTAIGWLAPLFGMGGGHMVRRRPPPRGPRAPARRRFGSRTSDLGSDEL